MFKTVLVPIDSTKASLRALKPAKAFADATGADLVVASVFFTEAIDETGRRTELMERAARYGVEVDHAIIRTSSTSVERGLHDLLDEDTLVVLASPGHSHTKRAFGNVSEEIIHRRKAGLSVVVGPRVDVDNYSLDGPMFGCIDPERPAEELLSALVRLTKEFPLAPWLVSVVQNIRVPAGIGGLPGLDVSLETRQLHALAERLQAEGVPTVNYDALHGAHAGRVITDFCNGSRPSLLVVATRDRDGLSRLFFGSVAIDIVKRSEAPVVAVHTAGGLQ